MPCQCAHNHLGDIFFSLFLSLAMITHRDSQEGNNSSYISVTAWLFISVGVQLMQQYSFVKIEQIGMIKIISSRGNSRQIYFQIYTISYGCQSAYLMLASYFTGFAPLMSFLARK